MDDFQRGLVELLPRLRRFARVLRSHDADAQDLVQQTVERALASRRGFKPGTRLDSWTFTIMRRIAIDDGRARQRWGQVLTPEDEATARVPDAAQADEGLRADARLVRDAIHALPEDQKHAVALVLVEGLSYAEAAQVLGVPAGTLTSRLVRGRQTLMQTLAEQGVTG
ncbi:MULTISPECIES: RNA polymerase sigma factor [unclassified Brevundimonas]|uniref:RNA polymerase sigma factor n=1 Tax=unclassified Brevundimonas TaxID=2622653 RepID=UPI0006D133E5|nr:MULTISPECIES: RNA polymerase sigma factor [unclassified Brevundimonas]ALJ08088.1 RNA polymerase subunit sigma-70 [Brevundimonas sp. DS20]QFU31338.1 ECF RNA polymerase sigma factor SigH [Brevundimonas sp. Bb-A]